MRMIVATTILGLAAGVGGTTLGGLFVILLGRVAYRWLSPMLAFAGGVMISIVVFDMMPSAVSASGVVLACVVAAVGGLVIYASEKVLEIGERRIIGSLDSLISIGLAVGTAIGLHNFAEGMAIGASVVVMIELGITVAVLIAVHNIPEGVAMSVPLRLKGVRPSLIVLFTALAGLPMGVGAMLAAYYGSVSRTLLAASFAFSSGAMGYVSIADLVPSAVRLSSAFEAFVGFVAGVVLGLAVVWAI